MKGRFAKRKISKKKIGERKYSEYEEGSSEGPHGKRISRKNTEFLSLVDTGLQKKYKRSGNVGQRVEKHSRHNKSRPRREQFRKERIETGENSGKSRRVEEPEEKLEGARMARKFRRKGIDLRTEKGGNKEKGREGKGKEEWRFKMGWRKNEKKSKRSLEVANIGSRRGCLGTN